MKLDVLIADPAGNITAFVFGKAEADIKKKIAAKLMENKELRIEQVGFCSDSTTADGRLEMAGGEFCGNASRAYALYLCTKRREKTAELKLEVSGCGSIIKARVNAEENRAEAEMPLPQYIQQLTVEGRHCTLVHLGGIAHLVVKDEAPSMDWFMRAERIFDALPSLEAYGVMFLDSTRRMLTPIVRVRAVNTLYREGSCASGSVACAVAESTELINGIFTGIYTQPAGSLTATVKRENGRVVYNSIGGQVRLGEWLKIDI